MVVMAGSTLIIALWVVAALCIAVAVAALVVAGRYGRTQSHGGDQDVTDGAHPATAVTAAQADAQVGGGAPSTGKRLFGFGLPSVWRFGKPSTTASPAPAHIDLDEVFPTDDDPTAVSPTGALSSAAVEPAAVPGVRTPAVPARSAHVDSDDHDEVRPDAEMSVPTAATPVPPSPAAMGQGSVPGRTDSVRTSAGGWKPRPPQHAKTAPASGGQPGKVVAGISAVVSPWTPAAQGRAGGRHRKPAGPAPVTPAHVQALVDENSSLPAPDRAGSAHEMAAAAAAAAAQARLRAAARLGTPSTPATTTDAAPSMPPPPTPAAPTPVVPPAAPTPVVEAAARAVSPAPAAPAPQWRVEDIPGASHVRGTDAGDDVAPHFPTPAPAPRKDSAVSSLSAQPEPRSEASQSDLDMTAHPESPHFDYRAYGLPEDLPLPMSGPAT